MERCWRKKPKESKERKDSMNVKNQEGFLAMLETRHTGAIVNKKSLFIGNNDFGLWCEDYKGINIDQSYFCNNKARCRHRALNSFQRNHRYNRSSRPSKNGKFSSVYLMKISPATI